MFDMIKVLTTILAMVFLTSSAFALPALQLYSPDATYGQDGGCTWQR